MAKITQADTPSNAQRLAEAISEVLSNEATPPELYNAVADSLTTIFNDTKAFDILALENLKLWLPRAAAKLALEPEPAGANEAAISWHRNVVNNLVAILDDASLRYLAQAKRATEKA